MAFLDSEGGPDLATDLRALRDESARLGWTATVEGMRRSLAATGGVGVVSWAPLTPRSVGATRPTRTRSQPAHAAF